jgi:putative phosphoesterase
MKIAVISDIHENSHNLIQALEIIQTEKCEILFCLWDVGRSTLFEMMFSIGLPMYFTFWNHDGNVIKDTKLLVANNAKVRSNWFYQKIQLDGRKIFLTHYDDLVEIVAKSWEFDACFWWHEHIAFEEQYSETLCVNPGEISGTRTWKPWLYIYETQTNSWDFYLLPDNLVMETPEVVAFKEKMKK